MLLVAIVVFLSAKMITRGSLLKHEHERCVPSPDEIKMTDKNTDLKVFVCRIGRTLASPCSRG